MKLIYDEADYYLLKEDGKYCVFERFYTKPTELDCTTGFGTSSDDTIVLPEEYLT